MNIIKAQYILAISILFGVALYSFYSNEEGVEVQESYKEIPKDYLKRDRGIAQIHSIKIKKNDRKKKDLMNSSTTNLFVRRRSNSLEVSDKNLIPLLDFENLDSLNKDLKFVKNYKAILKNEENLRLFPDSVTKGNFIIVGIDESVENSKTLVLNTAKNEVGIFFDVIKVKLSNDDSSELFNSLSSYSYEVLEKYTHINLYVIKFANSNETIAAHKLLKEKAFAKRLSLEIKYYFRTYR